MRTSTDQQDLFLSKPIIVGGIATIIAIILFALFNPFSWNNAGYRTVVTQAGGNQFVQYDPGYFYSGFFSKEQEWPNQISVSSREKEADWDLKDNTIEIGFIPIRFNDATTADAAGITQYVLPIGEKEMLEIHNAHKTPEALVQRRLGPYTIECLQNSAQLMSSEMHYGGGRAQMAQDYLDQLKNGAFLLNVQERNSYDSTEKTWKKIYAVEIQTDNKKQQKRKFSSIKEYSITVADAQITGVDYQEAVDAMLQKKIAAATEASISRQQLMTAQQQQLTAEAKGKQKLVEIEYQEKQTQTVAVVKAETQVELAKQDLKKQDIALQASYKEAQKIKTLADAEAYTKRAVMQADNALTQRLAAAVEINKAYAEAMGNSNWVPTYVSGGAGNNNSGARDLIDLMTARTAREVGLTTSNPAISSSGKTKD